MEQLFGYIERVVFHNPENGFTVARLQEPRKKELTTIVGSLPSLQPGETVRCTGKWKNNLLHGPQFEVETFHTEYPADLLGIQKYLESGLVKGIGPVFAKRMVEVFGTTTLQVIDAAPQRLHEVPGLGKKRVEKILECWARQKGIREVMLFLQQFGVSPAYALRIYKTYGEESIAKVRENPFYLARDIFGIGFKTADTIARKMGFCKDSAERVDAGLLHLLNELSEEGHVCFPQEEFLPLALALLEVADALLCSRLEALVESGQIVRSSLAERPFLWLKVLRICEEGIAKELRRLQHAPSFWRAIDKGKALDWVQTVLGMQLALHQREAVESALVHKILILTGGPGTGKSTITKAILAICEKLSSKILLAAPTGRAAKRMTEITGKPAKTLHSLLEYDFTQGGFRHGRDCPLDCDLLIVDEASMIDTHLMYSLLKALPSQCRLLLVGDINQLPSVGPGNVLQDLIRSDQFPVAELKQIFRQAAGSRIITNAHAINQGDFPDLRGGAKSDFFFLEAQEHAQVNQILIDLLTARLPKAYRLDPFADIQVLSPMKRGPLGTTQLNLLLQETLNPEGESLFYSGKIYRVGDKVMQIRNNYTKEVYNGDVGFIKAIDREEQQLIVEIDGRPIVYDFSELDELTLAYAVSVHKYQGSECPCILLPVHTSHFVMLHRNLLYTGVTRGKRLVILVGTKKAIALAVKNDEVKKRHTGLKYFLSTHGVSQSTYSKSDTDA